MRAITKSVTSTASKIVDAEPVNRQIYVHVVGNNIVYLGNSAITTAAGFPTEKAGTPLSITIPINETLWARTVSATEDIRILLPDGA